VKTIFYIFVLSDLGLNLQISNLLTQLLVSSVLSPPYLKFLGLSNSDFVRVRGHGLTDGRV